MEHLAVRNSFRQADVLQLTATWRAGGRELLQNNQLKCKNGVDPAAACPKLDASDFLTYVGVENGKFVFDVTRPAGLKVLNHASRIGLAQFANQMRTAVVHGPEDCSISALHETGVNVRDHSRLRNRSDTSIHRHTWYCWLPFLAVHILQLHIVSE